MTNDRHSGEVRISSENDIVAARLMTRDAATSLGFGVTDVTRVVTAASELARNVFHHAGEGAMVWRTIEADRRSGIELVFSDQGPGIANVEQAMEVGFSEQGSLGMGLPGTKRLMDEMEIQSTVGAGTTVTVRKWLRTRKR